MKIPRRLWPTLLVLLLTFSTACTMWERREETATSVAAVPTAVATSQLPSTSAITPVPTQFPTPIPTASARPAGNTAASPEASPNPTPAADIDIGQSAQSTVQQLAGTIGSRPAGSSNERQAADWIHRRLSSLGYETVRQPFPIRSFGDQSASLAVQSPMALSIPVINFHLGGSGDVTAEIVYAGLGRQGDIPPEVRGKIALIDRGEVTFQVKTSNAVAAGAVGVIIANSTPGELRGRLVDPATIPVVAVTQTDGQRLRELAQSDPVIAQLTASTEVMQGTSQNVIGIGGRRGGPIIIVGGHYDSVEAGPGANDNASGTAVALEIARVFAAEQRAEIRIVAFGAEEIGLVGSQTYVESLSPEERARIRLMINLDMVGVGDRFLVGGSQEFGRPAADLARRRGIDSAEPVPVGLDNSDHASFRSAGIPAIFFHWSDDPNYHTVGDRAEAVQPELLKQTAELTIDVIQMLLSEGF